MKKENRKQRKKKWIDAKNLMKKYPDCAYNGDFYCNHQYDEKYGWCWVDFRFFHTKLKKYFAVALTTLEYKAMGVNEEKVREHFDISHPYDEPGMLFLPVDKKTGCGRIEFTDRWREVYNIRKSLEAAMLTELNREAQMMRPYIDVKDYGKVAVGVWASIDVPKIDEHVIRDFIKLFQSLGEPTTPGRVWTGEEVEVVPERLTQRYAE